MARKIDRLNALAVTRANKLGMYADGGGLYLQVASKGAKSWIFRFMMNGREREMGLGPLHAVSLADARSAAEKCRHMCHQDIDPIEARRAQRAQAALETAKAITFKECAEAYIEAHKAGWRNAKHADQWTNTLASFAYPAIGDLSVQAVDTPLVLKVLEPIWAVKTETASRVRGRIEAVLDWAMARGYRRGENPARWRGHLDKLLPARAKVRKVKHHSALPYADAGDFMAELREVGGTAARALEFTILTAARTGEVIGARWTEIDMVAGSWTIPGDRMKAGQEHRVPLPEAALAILRAAHKERDERHGDFVFPGGKRGKSLSNMAMLALLERMSRDDLTVHGFRSTFRDWAAERTNFPNHVVEMALAHAVGDKVEAAYRRGDLFEKRRRLMDAWAKWCAARRQTAEVVSIAR
jgi:integrase